MRGPSDQRPAARPAPRDQRLARSRGAGSGRVPCLLGLCPWVVGSRERAQGDAGTREARLGPLASAARFLLSGLEGSLRPQRWLNPVTSPLLLCRTGAPCHPGALAPGHGQRRPAGSRPGGRGGGRVCCPPNPKPGRRAPRLMDGFSERQSSCRGNPVSLRSAGACFLRSTRGFMSIQRQ